MKTTERACGVLIHPTSFPSPYGIGDLGIEARKILRLLAQANVKLWQILPLGPTGYGDSPYSSLSCFAGNELLIDIRSLSSIFETSILETTILDTSTSETLNNETSSEASKEEISKESLANKIKNLCKEQDCTSRIDYNHVYATKMVALKEIATAFVKNHAQDSEYNAFCNENAWWLEDYALYQALVHHFNESRWFVWPNDIKDRKKSAISKWTKELASEIEIYKVLQYFFYCQWNSLHKYANDLGIKIIGDIPIFAASDSVDVWTNRKLFKIDAQGHQTALAGCPPDAFSPTGQLWGNPVYNWKEHEKDDFAWWRRRVEMSFKLVDILRIDHFRGFEAYWETLAGEETAVNGKWVLGPGMKLLGHFKGLNIIAEDLGFLTEEVRKLRENTGFPGMKILQFAWEFSDGHFDATNAYLPHNYEKNCIAYTGTHDNETSRGWFDRQDETYKDIIRRYLQCPNEEVVWQMIRTLLASSAKYAIFPMQDIMGLDNSARMNVPSTVGSSNWSWRMDPAQLENWKLDRLREYIMIYGRA